MTAAHEPVDGAGLALPEHARTLAEALGLSPRQVALLVDELRNALVPVRSTLEMEQTPKRTERAVRGIEQVLALADAIANLAAMASARCETCRGSGFVDSEEGACASCGQERPITCPDCRGRLAP